MNGVYIFYIVFFERYIFMTIGLVEMSNRRALRLKTATLKKLKEQRKQTRAAMQRHEGLSTLCDVEKTTYEHLTLSMVILNALSDQLLKHDFLPRTWDAFTLGSNFDKRFVPLLKSNAQGELWVEYFECDQPKGLMVQVAGNVAGGLPEEAPKPGQRPVAPSKAPRERPRSPTSDTSVMEMIRMRMPQPCTAKYEPSRG